MNKTEQEFLSALQVFRLGLLGHKINMDEVFKTYARYICDRTNDMLVYADRDNNIIFKNDVAENVALVYTSFDEAYKALFNANNIDLVISSAYNVFKDLSSREICTGIVINNGTSLNVFVPKDIMKLLIDTIDMIKSDTNLLKSTIDVEKNNEIS